MTHLEVTALKEYSTSLQNQNTALLIETQTLHRSLEALNQELNSLEQYYTKCRQQETQIKQLKQQIVNYQSQHSEMANRLSQMENMLNNQTYEYEATIQKLSEQLGASKQREEIAKRDMSQLRKRQNSENSRVSHLLTEIQTKEREKNELRNRVRQLEAAAAETNIEELVKNYEQIESVVLEKEQKVRQMENYIDDLQARCLQMSRELEQREGYQHQLQAQLSSFQRNQRMYDGCDEQNDSDSGPLSKMELIRTGNRLIERMVNLEKQNSMLMGNCPQTERYASSECGGSLRQSSSPSKLQLRIQALKMQNENLKRGLMI